MTTKRFAFGTTGRWWVIGLVATITATPATGIADCSIDGPRTVRAEQPFSLCAPRGIESYEWTGPGMVEDSHSRCVTIPGQKPGTYRYQLTTQMRGMAPKTCVQLVRVVGEPWGWIDCRIPGPRTVPQGGKARLCGDLVRNHYYLWSGPNSFKATTRCIHVDVPGRYDLSVGSVSAGTIRSCSFVLEGSPRTALPEHPSDAFASASRDPGSGCECRKAGAAVSKASW